METDELKILLALEPTWTVSLNGLEFQTIPSTEISLDGDTIRCGKWTRRIDKIEWLRPNIVRIAGRQRLRSSRDKLTLYPGEMLPSGAELLRRRRGFQIELGNALRRHFRVRSIERQTLRSNRVQGVSGAYPRYFIGNRAVIAVDSDESSAIVNGIMRAALLWSESVQREVTVVVPKHRAATLTRRLRRMPEVRAMMEWTVWDGESLEVLDESVEGPVETEVRQFIVPDVGAEVQRILAIAPDVLRATPNVGAAGVSIRLRGIEVACVRAGENLYPLGQPLEKVVSELSALRRYDSRHVLARAHEERWLESNIVDKIQSIMPAVDPAHVYSQVPSFIGEDRSIIDLLGVTRDGRLVVMEIKASADPELPFQALDYWIAVERHRTLGDFDRNGYFKGVRLANEPPILVMIAPLLSFHKSLGRLRRFLPREIPMIEIGLNQSWKKEIQILRRQGLVG